MVYDLSRSEKRTLDDLSEFVAPTRLREYREYLVSRLVGTRDEEQAIDDAARDEERRKEYEADLVREGVNLQIELLSAYAQGGFEAEKNLLDNILESYQDGNGYPPEDIMLPMTAGDRHRLLLRFLNQISDSKIQIIESGFEAEKRLLDKLLENYQCGRGCSPEDIMLPMTARDRHTLLLRYLKQISENSNRVLALKRRRAAEDDYEDRQRRDDEAEREENRRRQDAEAAAASDRDSRNLYDDLPDGHLYPKPDLGGLDECRIRPGFG